MSARALVIGGTGPTGPHIVAGLCDREFEVTVLHRGVHEIPELADVEHIHADPHVGEFLVDAIGTRRFDVVVAQYGRVKTIAEVFAGRCDQLVAIGGVPVYRGALEPHATRPFGVPVNVTEDSPLADEGATAPPFAQLVVDAERAVLEHQARGSYRASVVRYAIVYGPRNIVPWEWSVLRRVRDGRRTMILPDDGLGITSRCAARNGAELVLAIVDHPDVADGQAYNGADAQQFTFRQWVDLVAGVVDAELEIVGLPMELAEAAQTSLMPMPGIRPHLLLDTSKARRELGLRDVVSAPDAIASSVRWLIDNPPADDLPHDQFDYTAEDRLVTAYRRAIDDVRRATGIPASRTLRAYRY